MPGEFHVFGQTILLHGRRRPGVPGHHLSIPIGFVNSVTQYVLDSSTSSTHADADVHPGVVFNVVGNLDPHPEFRLRGAAAATIASEVAPLIPLLSHHRAPPWARCRGCAPLPRR